MTESNTFSGYFGIEFSPDLQGSMFVRLEKVFENSENPENIPDISDSFIIDVNWTLSGSSMGLISGTWEINVFLESYRGTQDIFIFEVDDIPLDPTGNGHYQSVITIPEGWSENISDDILRDPKLVVIILCKDLAGKFRENIEGICEIRNPHYLAADDIVSEQENAFVDFFGRYIITHEARRLFLEELKAEGHLKENGDQENVQMESPQKEIPSYVNFEFTDVTIGDEPKDLLSHEGFSSGCLYRLTISIALTPDIRFRTRGDQSEQQPPIVRPKVSEESLELFVAIFVNPESVLKVISEPLDTLIWTGDGISSKNAIFKVEAASTDIQRTAILDVYFYYKTNLIYISKFSITIRPEGSEWELDNCPISWLFRSDEDRGRSKIFQKFAAINKKAPRAVNIAIQRSSEKDDFVLTAFIDRAELPARVTMTVDQLNGFLERTRAALDKLRQETIYVEGGYNKKGQYIGDYIGVEGGYDWSAKKNRSLATETFKKFLREMAELGSFFCEELFATESGKILRRAIIENLQAEDIIQIWVDWDAHDFIYPWVWLYDQDFDPDERLPIVLEKFWGYRFIIEQLPQYPETAGEPMPSNIISHNPLDVKIGMANIEPGYQAQKKFFETNSKYSKNCLKYEIWDHDEPWQTYLVSCTSQILYFYSHGYTALPKTREEGKLYDMLAIWKKWLEQPLPDESEMMKQYRLRGRADIEKLEKNENMLMQSYIQLTNGYLRQNELRRVMNLKRAGPLVFLNMCESAQVFPIISEGLIDVFLKKGAGGVIGTEMPMLPNFADLFARQFFEKFFYGQEHDNQPITIGRVLYELRRKFMDLGNPLGFAYTFFGDVNIRLDQVIPAYSE